MVERTRRHISRARFFHTLAWIGLGTLEDLEEVVPVEGQGHGVRLGLHGGAGGLPVHHADLAEGLRGLQEGDDELPLPEPPQDADLAFQQEVHLEAAEALFEDAGPHRELLLGGPGPKEVELLRPEILEEVNVLEGPLSVHHLAPPSPW